MFSKSYFAYIRVSTARQGHFGTSLVEQRSAIKRCAQQKNLHISKEFQEQETAAKGGRPVFLEMLRSLQEGKAAGVIMHKIDRGARNLKDWAELGDLIDAGIEMHFANENLDLYSRGGRLSADIQAVVAADYIRNLREEVKKGFYGRIKQGLYPMPAPLGYLNTGGGKAKAVDTTTAPFIQQMFKLYASGKFSLHSLAAKMKSLGLRQPSGHPVSVNTIARMLHNLFYAGIIRIKISEEYFVGLHEPIVSKQLFDTVQSRLESKMNRAVQHSRLQEAFLFRRLLVCAHCLHHLVGEKQKGYIYYRCHTRSCPQKTIREEKVRASVWSVFKKFERLSKKRDKFQEWLNQRRQNLGEHIEVKRERLLQQARDIKNRLTKLTDAFISEMIDKPTFLETKNRLVAEEVKLKQTLTTLEVTEYESLTKFEVAFESVQNAWLSLRYASYKRKREILQTIIKTIEIKGKLVIITLHSSFETMQHHLS